MSVSVCCVDSGDTVDSVTGMPHHTIYVVSFCLLFYTNYQTGNSSLKYLFGLFAS